MSWHAAMVMGFSLLGAVLLSPAPARGQESPSSFVVDYEVWLVEGGKIDDDLERLTGSPEEVAAGARRIVKSEGFHALNGRFSMAAGKWETATAPIASRSADATAADGINGGNDPGGRSVLYAQC